MKRRPFFLLPGLLLGLAGWLSPLSVTKADPAPPELGWETSLIVQRNGGPAVVQVRLQPRPGGLQRGRLRCRVTEMARPVLEFSMEDVILTAGEQRLRLVVPPIPLGHETLVSSQASPLRLELIFVAEGREYRLGDRPLAVGGESATLALLVDATENALLGLPEGQEFLKRLAPESWQLPGDPNQPRAKPLTPVWQTSRSEWRVSDLPADALLYMGFDVLLLTGEGVGSLRSDQRDALGQWIGAGGSLGVVLPPTPLRPDALAWLNRLLVDGPEGMLESADFTGRVALPDTDEVRLAHYGLGRVVLLATRDDGTLPSRAGMARAVPFLWKWSRRQRDAFLESGEWRPGQIDVSQIEDPRFNDLTPLLSRMRRALLPQDLRPLGMSVVIAILGAYLLWIGPLDYFLLGRFKARRWTWVTFPVATLVTTGVLVLLSNRQLAGHDAGVPVQIIDLGPGNQPVRVTRLQALIAAREQQTAHRVPRGWVIDQTFTDSQQTPLVYEGSPLRDQRLELTVAQWSPRLLRTTWMPAPGETGLAPHLELPPCPIDLEPLRSAWLAAETEFKRRDVVQAWLNANRAEGRLLHILDGTESPQAGWLQGPSLGPPVADLCQMMQRTVRRDPLGNAEREPLPEYRRSPAVGGDLSDLCLLDTTESASCLVVVITRTPGGDWLMWRKLLQGD